MMPTTLRLRSIALICLVIVLTTSCGREPLPIEAAASGRPGIAHALADYLHSFASLGEMVATSHIVVAGRVASIRRAATPSEGAPETTDRIVVFEVDSVLYRRDGAPGVESGDRIEIDGEGWWEGPTRVVVNGVEWSKPGGRAFYFLTAGPCPGDPFTLINDQGRYLARDRDLYGTSSNDRLINEILAMSPAELQNAIAHAAERVRAGRIEPQRGPTTACPGS